LDFPIIHFIFVENILRINLRTTLKNITIVTSGIYIAPDVHGNTYYLQAKHFNYKGVIEILPEQEVWLNEKNGKHLLKTGDILFAAKGTKNFAAVFNKRIGDAVASSTFLILRINDQFKNKIIPEYIAWWLNSEGIQKLLKNLAVGSALPSISKSVLQKVDIYIPEINKQQLILKIAELRDKESEYIRKIDKLRKSLIQRKILNSIFNNK